MPQKGLKKILELKLVKISLQRNICIITWKCLISNSRYPFESEEAKLLNKQIFETIYYGAMEASCELAEALGPYETYEGSPVSKGVS